LSSLVPRKGPPVAGGLWPLVLGPPNRWSDRVADLARPELRLHPENAGDVWSQAPLKHSKEIVTSTSQGTVRL